METDLIKKLEKIIGEEKTRTSIVNKIIQEDYNLYKNGYNQCLAEVKAKLPDLVKVVLEKVESKGFIFGEREGDAFKQVEIKQIINEIKDE